MTATKNHPYRWLSISEIFKTHRRKVHSPQELSELDFKLLGKVNGT
jgi:hypothetical protein